MEHLILCKGEIKMEENKTQNQEKENIFKKAKKKAADVRNRIIDVALENPQISLTILSGFGMLVAGGAKALLGSGSNKLDKCRVQDDVTEEYFVTTHPLTNDEILELGERMIDGESKGKALKDMGVLREEKKRK